MSQPIPETSEQLISKAIRLRINQADEAPPQGLALFEQLISARYPGMSIEAVSVAAMINSIDGELEKLRRKVAPNPQHWIEVGQLDLFNTDSHKIPPWIADPNGTPRRGLDSSLSSVRDDVNRRVTMAAEDRDKLAEQWDRMRDRVNELERYLQAIDRLISNARASGINPDEVTYAEIIAQAHQTDGGLTPSAQPQAARHLCAVRSAS